MVSPEQEKVPGVFDLVGEQQANSLEGKFASIDIVAQEKIVGIWRVLSVIEQSQQIGVLTVDVTLVI